MEKYKEIKTNNESVDIKTRFLKAPMLMHVELTTRCPLNCKQCYCDLSTGKDIDKSMLFSYLEEAAEIGIKNIAFSGGEPLVYPYLVDVISYATKLGLYSAVATSGYGLDKNKIDELEGAGISQIYISLNGSTKEIHNKSRDAFEESIKALKLLRASNIKYAINWVARKDNAKDFGNLVKLAKEYEVSQIAILVLKPDSKYQIDNYLNDEEFFDLARLLRKYNDRDLPIYVESCYSNLRAYLLSNRNKGIMAGCTAGRYLMAIDVEGRFMPCRHLPFPEKYPSIKEYWNDSATLRKLRVIEENIKDPCRNCKYMKNCLSCRATSIKLYDDFYAGDKMCPVPKKKDEEEKFIIDITKIKWLQK